MLNTKQLVIAGLVLAGMVFILWAFLTTLNTRDFRTAEISFKYPSSYTVETDESQAPEGATKIARLARAQPQSLIVVHKAPDAHEAAAALKVSQIDYLERNADMTLESTYANFEKKASERFKVSGHDALSLSFAYTGEDKQTKVHMRYMMVLANDAIYYVTIQSTDEKLLLQDAQLLLDSLRVLTPA